MKHCTLIVLMVLFLGSTAQASAKVSMAVSRREEYVFVPLNHRETRVELARIYNTGDAPLELTLTWTQTWGILEGVLAPDALILEPNETQLCYLVFNASAMGGLSGVLEVMAVQEELVLNGSGAGGAVVPAFEVRKSVTVAEPPVLDVELQMSPNGNLAVLAIQNVGPEPVDELLIWQVMAPEWLCLSENNGFGPTNVEVAVAPDLAPGTYEGDLLIESNVGSERVPLTVVVEEHVEPEPDPPQENTTPVPSPSSPPEDQGPEFEEPESEPESVNWVVWMGGMGLVAVGALTAINRRVSMREEEGDEGDEEAENEMFTELKRTGEPEGVFSELRRRMRAEKR